MFAVAFEVLPSEDGVSRYLSIAAALKPTLDAIDGFLSVERFQGLNRPGWILSLSLWRDEAAVIRWRSDAQHHAAQHEGRQHVFTDYRLRVLDLSTTLPDASRPGVALLDHADPALPLAGSRYASLSTPGKLIDLLDGAAEERQCALRRYPDHAGRLLHGSVVRDYGMHARDQAPQVLPAPAAMKGHRHG